MKKFALIIGLIFCSIALGDDIQPPQQPVSPASANQPTTIATQTNPNVTMAPGTKDIETADKLFKDATYDNFAPQPEQPFIDPDNLNNPNTPESGYDY